MSLLPIWAQFHISVHDTPPVVPLLLELPSSICSALVPSGVSPLTHATPSLFPPLSIFLSTFACSSYCVVAYSPLLPKLLFCTSGYAQNLQIFSTSLLSIIFLLPFSCTGMFTSASAGAGALLDVASRYFTNHSIVMLTGSLGLEKL